MDEVVLPCTARSPQRFNRGTDHGQIKNAILALSVPLKSALLNALNITAAGGTQALHRPLPQAGLNSRRAAIDTYTFTPSADNLIAAGLENRFADVLLTPQQRSCVFLEPGAITRKSVVCNDLAPLGG